MDTREEKLEKIFCKWDVSVTLYWLEHLSQISALFSKKKKLKRNKKKAS